MVPGTILHDPNFRFHDGKAGNKLFVVLNDGRDGHYIAVKTTSRGDRYTFVYGCQVLGRFPHFYLPPQSCCLDGQSWLCLDEFYELDVSILNRRLLDLAINRIGVLPEPITLEVMGCAISCDDISMAHAENLRTVWKERKAALEETSKTASKGS